MSVRECQRCEGKTAKNLRCKNRTCKSSLCWQHLKKLHNLRIKPSNIIGAHDGLFTLRDIREGANIGPYTGKLRRHNPNNDYVIELDKRHFIDGIKINSSYVRYANV